MSSIDQLATQLNQCASFEELFVKVSELKTHMDANELRVLRYTLQRYDFGYSSVAMVYLCDMITKCGVKPLPLGMGI